jgi:formylglycine-generating enzyme required for sulfatase activity
VTPRATPSARRPSSRCTPWWARFRIDRDEVTQRAYGECVAAGACTAPSTGLAAPVQAQRPVASVTWAQARAFCAWRRARLPTEAEWELAARGEDGRIYPWGDALPTCDHAWTSACGVGPADVGGRPLGASPYGVRDLAGNVDEWVEDRYAPYAGGAASAERIARGGAYDAWHARSTARNALAPEHHDPLLGFRCASD